MADIFAVDRAGLARKLAHRPKAFIVYELLQNAWDEDCTQVEVRTRYDARARVCHIAVEDDAPDGFSDLKSAYTLFRDSKKAADPEKRGRFELGEKLVIALALRAEVVSTTGTVRFVGDRRSHHKKTRGRGTLFSAAFSMRQKEYDEMLTQIAMVIPPHPSKVVTLINSAPLVRRREPSWFRATLPTIVAKDGALRPTVRKTTVCLYAPRLGEETYLYEMGLPICPTGDSFHYDVQQRVPCNWERDGVSQAYLRALRVAVLNETASLLTANEVQQRWVTGAIADERVTPEAVTAVVHRRFGEKVVINDPSDPEGTKLAVSQGYAVLPGGTLPGVAWRKLKELGKVKPAGQVTPSPKPYSADAAPERVIPMAEWTPRMHTRAAVARVLFARLVAHDAPTENARLDVVIAKEPQASWAANFGKTGPGRGRLCLNYARLGKNWFERAHRDVEVLDLLLHEFCHYSCTDHLSHQMHEAATRLGALLANLALDEPEILAR